MILMALLSKLIEDYMNVAPRVVVHQQDTAPAYAARQMQKWLQRNVPDFIYKD